MKQQQTILIAIGVILIAGIYFIGNIEPPKKAVAAETHGPNDGHNHSAIDINTVLTDYRQKLNPSQQAYLTGLESAVVRGDVKAQQIQVYKQLAGFWKDSANAFLPYAWYMGEAAKLENSEKSLTFAARLFLEDLRGLQDLALKSWEADQSKMLFEKALAINPNNDSAKIGLGSTFIFGASAAEPQGVMQGIQQILEVARKDSNNMYAQLMLGIGGITSGQYDKAIERLTKVVTKQPSNLEAVFMLAEAFERKGDNASAIKWYEAGKKEIPNAAVQKEIDARIEMLKK